VNGLGVARRWASFGLAVVVVALALTALPALARKRRRNRHTELPLIGSRLACGQSPSSTSTSPPSSRVPDLRRHHRDHRWRTRDEKYDWLAHEFVKLTFAAFSTTALLGAFLLPSSSATTPSFGRT